jgi:hypothetical protein
MDKIIVKTQPDSNMVEIKATLSYGKVCVIMNALRESDSVVANDLRCMLRNAIYNDAQKNPNSPIPAHYCD